MHDVDRASILAKIAAALRGGGGVVPAPALPPVYGGADAEIARDRAALAERFRRELRELGGETRFVAREEDLAGAIAAYAAERGLGPASADYTTADYALLRAEALLADTGSAIVIERSADRRLAPYLPRTCIIVGDAHALYPGLSNAALAQVYAAARRGDRGEALIVSGPSRTADIEKVIVLGAHGPRNVAVFIVGIEP